MKTYLFACDRYMSICGLTAENIKEKIVIFDRYVPSALAYRMADGCDYNWVKEVNSIFPVPDYIIYIDITAEESVARESGKKFGFSYELEHLRNVRESYLKLLDHLNMVRVDGMRPLDEVYSNIREIIGG